jgi:hypothetical protein
MPRQPAWDGAETGSEAAAGSWAAAVEIVNWRLMLALIANAAVWAQLSELIVGWP